MRDVKGIFIFQNILSRLLMVFKLANYTCIYLSQLKTMTEEFQDFLEKR